MTEGGTGHLTRLFFPAPTVLLCWKSPAVSGATMNALKRHVSSNEREECKHDMSILLTLQA